MEERTSAERIDSIENRFPLPENYEVQSLLGAGGFGQVIQCFKKDTQETVAVKIPGPGVNLLNESTMLCSFKYFNMDKCNIVTFIDAFMMRDNRMALVCEKLDITLSDYLIDYRDLKPLDLHEIRSVIEQMATALNALKDNGIIHSDIKLDNVMLVDCKTKPIRVKLIDFGLALLNNNARRGHLYQTEMYRAPEVDLGLPLSEAIDMWSLGILMSLLMLGDCMNQGKSRYEKIRRMVDLLGLPPDHLLDEGWYTKRYFIKTSSGNWRLKTLAEFWEGEEYINLDMYYTFTSLDELETLPMPNLDAGGPDEKKECIDLLKAMLRLDAKERITPAEVLNHPFIKRGNVQHISDSKDSSGSHDSTKTSFPHVIMVQPAPPDCCNNLDDDDEQRSKSCSVAAPSENTSPEYPVAAPSENTSPEYPLRDESGCPVSLFFAKEHGLEHGSELTTTTMAGRKFSSPRVSDDTDTEQKRTTKKKNCIKRFFRWMKKTFCSCTSTSTSEDQD